MQEGSGAWDPISVNHHLPWLVKIYVIYLVYVVVRSSVQIISCGIRTWKPRNEADNGTAMRMQVASLKRRVITVFLAALLVSTAQISNALRFFVTTVVGPRGLVGELSEGLVPMTMGLIVALAMHLAIAFIESAIDKRLSTQKLHT